MLVFIDESGHPHPNDSATRPVVVAVCLRRTDSRGISAQIHSLKRRVLAREDIELKGVKLLTRGTFQRRPEKKELVECFFDLCRNLPLTIFAIVMERPTRAGPGHPTFLPNQFRYLLQRVDLLLEQTQDMATILIDGDGSQYGGLPRRFESFLHRSAEGRALTRIMDAPFFVDSRITPGIQIADMAASVLRQYEENQLFRRVPPADAFLSAIRRYYAVLQEKTVDLETDGGYPRHGFYRMPEDAHYHDQYLLGPQALEDLPMPDRLEGGEEEAAEGRGRPQDADP